MDFHVFLIGFIASASAGMISGLFGGGTGLVLVPATVMILQYLGVDKRLIMHMAIGTGIASVILTGTVAVYSHNKRGSIQWKMIESMTLALLVGVAVGAVIANHISSSKLMLLFGVGVILLAGYVLFGRENELQTVNASKPLLVSFAGIIGLIGSALGINPFCVPFFKRIGMDIRTAIGTTTVIGLFMAMGIVVSFILVGWRSVGLPAYSTGYVDWQLVIPLSTGGILFAPLGVKLAHRLPRNTLKTLYAGLLFVVGFKMIYPALLGLFH